MLLLENTPTLPSSEIMSVYNNTSAESGIFSPQLRDRPKYLPEWVIAELADRSSLAVVEYINSLRESISHCCYTTHTSLEPHDNPQARDMSTVTYSTASERLGGVFSNQYKRRMQRNRPAWYKGSPLDTAPKIFAPWRRNHVPLIRDWQTSHRVVSKKAAWMGNVFSDKHYEINGVIWDWDDPASKFLVDLFTGVMETVEFAISADAFWAPHIVVTHSPGDEPEYLDSHGNPDQLTNHRHEDDPRQNAPIPEGYTPRQNTIGPTGMEQLFLPPRQHMIIEREDWVAQCAETTINRYRAIQKLSIRFHLGLERVRAGQRLLTPVNVNERGRDTNTRDIAGSHGEGPDFVPMTQDEVMTGGWSDADATSSLLRRGIMFQMCMSDLAEMADAAILSDDEDAEDEEIPEPSLPPEPSIPGDTYDALRKLGMVYGGEDEYDSDEDEVDEDEIYVEGQVSSPSLPRSQTISPNAYAILRELGMVFGDEEDGSESEDDERSITEPSRLGNPDFQTTILEPASPSSQPDSAELQASTGSLDLASILTEERSSVSSLSEDQESDASGCETPDTEDYYDC